MSDLWQREVGMQHRIGLPVDARDHVFVKPEFLEHGAAGAVDELAVDDVPQRVGIDDQTDIVGADVAYGLDRTGALSLGT